LLPEETFVPWLVLLKVAATVDVDGQLIISGISGKEGRGVLTVKNRSTVSVKLKSVSWEVDGVLFSADPDGVQISPASSLPWEIPLERVGKRYSEEAAILLTTPNGDSHAVKFPLRVEIRQMQTQNIDLLDDL
jgi:hypothetical protein